MGHSASDRLNDLLIGCGKATIANHADEDYWAPFASEEEYEEAMVVGVSITNDSEAARSEMIWGRLTVPGGPSVAKKAPASFPRRKRLSE